MGKKKEEMFDQDKFFKHYRPRNSHSKSLTKEASIKSFLRKKDLVLTQGVFKLPQQTFTWGF